MTVADLLVGLAETAFVGFKMNDRKPYVKISKSFLVIVSGASVFFLVLISLERSFALKRPLRHRVTSTKVYTHGIVIVWLAAIALGALKLLPIYGIFDLKYYVVAYSVMIALSLLLICFSYLSIRKRFCKRNPVLDTGYSRKTVFRRLNSQRPFLAGLPRARSARGTEPHTYGIWSTSFRLVVT